MDEARPVAADRFAPWWSGGLVVASALLVAALSRGFPNGVLEDDAYFYLGIADHLAQGLSSFDGYETTNGYHPLWAWTLACVQPLAWVAGDSGRLVAVFVAALLSGVMLWRIAGAQRAPAIAVASAITLGWLTGILMEGVLAALLIVLLLAECEVPRRPWLLATMAALLPLARLEMVCVPVALALAAAVNAPANRRAAVALAAGALTGVALLATWNLAVAGAPMSISSVLKAAQLRQPFSARVAHNVSGGNLLRWLVVAVVGGVGTQALWRSRRREALVVVCAVHVVLCGLALVTRMRDWYFAPAILCSLSFVPWRSRKGAVVAGLASLAAMAIVYDVWRNAADARLTREFVEHVNDVHHRTEPIYQVDGSGFTGFWLDAPVVNGDGVVNSFEHLQSLREGRLVPWLRERGIRHVMLTWPAGPGGRLIDHADLHLSTSTVHEIAAVQGVRNPFAQFRLVRVDTFVPPQGLP